MELRQSAELALANLLSSKLRSFLAVLGILVGTAAVVALISLGEIATGKALEQFETLGTDLMAVTLFEGNSSDKNRVVKSLSLEDIQSLKESLPDIEDIAPYMTVFQEVSYHGQKIQTSIIAAEESLSRIINVDMEEGNFVSFLQDYEKFCVVGYETAQELMKLHGSSVLGRQIWLGDTIYTVIGVMKKLAENPFFNQDVNKSVIIPIQGAVLLNSNAKINNMIFRLSSRADIDKAVNDVTQAIQALVPDSQLFSRSAREIIKRMENQGQIFTLLLGVIGGISLLVGGIGVMNIMLVSVTERRREIGIRKAIGAKQRDIRDLFLVESIILGFLGGLLGIVTGLFAVWIIGLISGWGFQFFAFPPVVGFIVSCATGVFFGFYPALRASKLDPIETLRHE